MEIMNLVILKSVIGNLLFLFKLKKYGTTDPLEPITFPYLTTENKVEPLLLVFADIKSLSEANFVAPYRFIGLDALSVDNATTFLILFNFAALITLIAPFILVLIHS